MKKTNGYFLAVSSLNYRKNFVVVLQAFDKFCEYRNEGNLLIIGDLKCESFNGIDISHYKRNSRIKFLGRVSDDELISYYQNAVCFIFPSLYEGFGIPVIEAQACGCPVISSNSSSLQEVLDESAIMCNPTDIEGVANAMKSIYEDDTLRNTIISKGFENAKRFSWEKSARKIVSIITI